MRRMSRAQLARLLRKVFEVDPLTCKRCGAEMKVISVITEGPLIDKLLKQESYFERGTRSQRVHHIQGWVDSNGDDKVIVQWGFGANGGPHHSF